MYRQTALIGPSVMLELVGAALDVPRPSEDGWGYHVPPLDLGDGPPGSPGPALIRRSGDWPGGPSITPSGACLAAFIRLANVPDTQFPAEVLAFARRWGPLELCRHGLPGAPLRCVLFPGSAFHLPAEPLADWRRYARQLLALLTIGARLQQDEYPERAEWEIVAAAGRERRPLSVDLVADDCLHGYDDSISIPDLAAPLDRHRSEVECVQNIWWRYGNVRPESSWHPGQTMLKSQWTHSGLAAVLAIQLAASLGDTIYTCADCRYPFTIEEGRREEGRRRRPARGRRAYCETCGPNGRYRVAQRERYRREKALAQRSS